MEVNRPKQHKQTSRKGKKAWIKNIDLDDIQAGLEENRDNLIKFGVDGLNELKSDNLFVVDTKGSDDVVSKPVKILKSTEILSKRSKVPGLDHHLHQQQRKNRVTKKDYEYLMAVSGRNKLQSASKAVTDKKGFATTKAYDVWNLDDDEQKGMPEILKNKSSTEWTKPKSTPSTLKLAPLVVEEVEKIPDAGRSYNPSLESWRALIEKEFITEQEKETVRVELQEKMASIKLLVKSLGTNEEDDDDSEEEQEEEQDGEVGEEDFKLSLNAPVVNKKKTKTQRNKQKRHQERLNLERELKDLKKKIKELESIETSPDQVSTASKSATVPQKIQKRKKLGTRHQVENQNLDVKLSDELTDSLRGLKPEGNLLQDTMFTLQSRGKIETRIPLKQRRRYRQKVTEKWTYKDFK